MPTYDYECSACGHKFEIFERHDESPVKPCPKCGKKKAQRMLGIGAGVIFKGSGFHVTDYKKGGGGNQPTGRERSGGAAESNGSKPAEPAKKKTVRKEKKD